VPALFFTLALFLRPLPTAREEMVRYDTAARALRAETALRLAHVLDQTGQSVEAEAIFRDPVGRRTDTPDHPACFGAFLKYRGRKDEAGVVLDRAIEVCRGTIARHPDDAITYTTLGQALADRGKAAEADAAYRAAVKLEPDSGVANGNLGLVLSRAGRYAKALNELRRGHELGSRRPDWSNPSAQRIREAERLAALDARLPALLKGNDHPVDVNEAMTFARLCSNRELHAAAARLFADALQSNPGLAGDRTTEHTYTAACVAALAGCGQAKDEPPPDEPAARVE
jgi:tetratricopeptide (TPR) repeat protein